MTALSPYVIKQKQDELWRRGVLVPWLCHDVQQKMHSAITESTSKKYVINSARRLGKSYFLVCLALEYALQHPNAQIKYAAETQRSVKKIIIPLVRQILETCPKALRPKFHSHDGVYTFYNGSEIHIAGAAMEQADSLRGTSCDLAVVDEAGFVDDLEYLIDSILMPQTLTRPNARIVMASTPSKTPDHPFVSKYMQQAMATGAYSRFTIYDNPLITPETIEEFKKEAGGEDSTTWRREYLAEVVTDASNALFPEATDTAHMDSLIVEVERPPFFIPITVMDVGYLDYTGVLFAYYDFVKAKIVIQDEILVNRHTSAAIVELVRAKEKELWGDVQPPVRIADATAMLIADLNQTHNFGCRIPDKGDLSANVNRVRVDLAESRILFHPRCKNTIAQVRYGTWDAQKRTFSRSSDGGHWDLAAALVYLCKHADRLSNPIPAGYGYDAYNDFGYPRRHKNTVSDSFKTMFPAIFKNRPA